MGNEPLRRAASAVARWPWWCHALLIACSARAWSAVVFAVVDRQAPDGPWGASPLGYSRFVSIWDGQWYRTAARLGYPSHLPTDASGAVQENPWAFHPLYAWMVRFLVNLTGLDFTLVAPALALLTGLGAAVVWLALLRGLTGERTAVWVLAVLLFSPVSGILQAAYAESLMMLLLAAVLILWRRQHLVLTGAAVALLCLSRPVGVPMAAAMGIFWCLIVLRGRGPALPALALALWACAAALAWPALAWRRTEQARAYLETEAAWREGGLVPVQPWVELAQRFFGSMLGWPAFVLGLAAVIALLGLPAVRRALGLKVWLWVVCYAGYLLLFFHPQSSTFRMLLPLAPLLVPLVAASDSRAYRLSLCAFGALGQIVWIGILWQWSPLPGGGDYPP